MNAALANSKIWSDSKIVAEYESAVDLQPPEAAILAQLRSRLAAMKMLTLASVTLRSRGPVDLVPLPASQ